MRHFDSIDNMVQAYAEYLNDANIDGGEWNERGVMNTFVKTFERVEMLAYYDIRIGKQWVKVIPSFGYCV